MDALMLSRFPLFRLPVFVVLLALSGLFLAGAAHASPLFPSPSPSSTPLAFEEEVEGEEEGEEVEGEFEEGACEAAEEEFEEGELDAAEVKEICEEEKSSEREAGTRPPQGKAKHRRHAHKKACQHRAGKRHCPRRPHRSHQR